MKKNNGFTLIEVIIACGVLSLFMAGLFSLYSSGSKMGNATMWLQSTTNQLKSAARQMNDSIRKSSYPSKIEFPKTIYERNTSDFGLRYFDGTVYATDTRNIFLVSTESTPAKTGFSQGNASATLVYHVYSLDSNGDLTYSKYREYVEASDIDDLTRTPPGEAKGIYRTVLVKNVESVTCARKDSNRVATLSQPLEITINCVMPRSSETKRSEKVVASPNVELTTL